MLVFLQVRGKGPEAPGAPRAEEQVGGGRGPRGRRPGAQTQGPPAAVQSEAAGRALQRGAAEDEQDGCGGAAALATSPLQRGVPAAATGAAFITERGPRGAAGPPPCKPTGLSERLGHFMRPQPHVVKPVSGGGGLAV